MSELSGEVRKQPNVNAADGTVYAKMSELSGEVRKQPNVNAAGGTDCIVLASQIGFCSEAGDELMLV